MNYVSSVMPMNVFLFPLDASTPTCAHDACQRYHQDQHRAHTEYAATESA